MRNLPFLAQIADHFNLRHNAVLLLSVMRLLNFSIGSRQLMNLVHTAVPIFPLVNFDFVSSLVNLALRIVPFSLTVDPPVKLVRLTNIISETISFMFFSIVGPYSFFIISFIAVRLIH